MTLNLSLPPRRTATASTAERDPASYATGFEAGVAAERARWTEAGALKGREPAAGGVDWDATVAELNAELGLSVRQPLDASVAAEQAKWVSAGALIGALIGSEPAAEAATADASSWDEIVASLNAEAGVTVPRPLDAGAP